jgi:threonine/homoserine/homoserine lactone efflux protein
MIDIIFRGIIIGIFVSAPLGPIGLLCIQRSLYKGRWHGFLSGIGAAFSDLFYAMITCMGMGIVIDFIEHNQMILKLAGSLLLIVFVVYMYRSDPSKSFREPKRSRSYWQDILSAFFVTLSNPLIIFWFIILFARFNFISSNDKMYSIGLGLICIFSGALLWWFALSSIIGKLRGVFNKRGLLIMNRTLAIILLIISLVGIISSIWELYQLYA